ncbi:ATP-binding protein [Natrinema versiforme]|uniref:histidine kinase n=1 Tax=Natrinema versiforme TaxID=88724 RepID=A0A4V1FYZ1_9EURY|nr:PAS domain-containing sensor histidine kinase [Natrinema versiforme]QCS41492.1 PAS domain S-box protein [Natrinema versiforme]
MSLVGLGLLGIVVAYALAFGGPPLLLALEMVVPTAIGVALVGYGLRTDAADDPDRAVIVTIGSCICGALVALFCLCSIALLSVRMGFSGGFAQPVINASSTGLAFGAAIGHVYAEFSQQYRENERLSRAVDASMDGIAVVVDDRHVYANEAYAALYGLGDGADLEGQQWCTLYTNDSQRRIEREVVPALSDRNYWRGTLTGTRTDGTTYPQDVTVSSLEDGYVVVARDVTNQRDREQRIQVLNRVLRHNLRNAFTVIRGHANMIGERDPELEARHVQPIRAEIDDLLATADKARGVERTLDRHGNADLINPGEAVRRVTDRALSVYPNADIVSRVEDGGAASATPTVDDTVVDALNELVDNAVEHNTATRSREPVATDGDGNGHADVSARSGGRPSIEIAVSTVESDSRTRLEFTITDDGPGIPETERRAVLAGHETALDHGSGLGLWLVNWIVRTTGGELSFSDVPEGGTTVRLSFPAVADAAGIDTDAVSGR